MVEFTLAGDEDRARLQGWLRAGSASARTNRVTGTLGGGLTFGDDGARIGFAVAHARQSDRAARRFSVEEGPQVRAETAFELGVAAQVSDVLTVQPVAHYVINPGWRADGPDALVAGLRLSCGVER